MNRFVAAGFIFAASLSPLASAQGGWLGEWTPLMVCGDYAVTIDMREYLPSDRATTVQQEHQFVVHDLSLVSTLIASLQKQNPTSLKGFTTDPHSTGEFVQRRSLGGQWDPRAIVQAYNVAEAGKRPDRTLKIVREGPTLRLSVHEFNFGTAGREAGEGAELANFVFHDCR